jgi:hypothetical protein
MSRDGSIEDLIGFTKPLSPDIAEDLADLQAAPARLTVAAETRNLDRLADWRDFEALWFYGMKDARLAEILPRVEPRYLSLVDFKSPDLAFLPPFARLEALELGHNTKLADLSDLSRFTGLRLLSLLSCPKVRDIAPIGDLVNLEVVDLGGGMWDKFRTPTLAPLRRLENLRFVALKAIRVEDESLEPLARLRCLEGLELSNQFPTAEYARLSVALPQADCEMFQPFTEANIGRKARTVMVTGKRKPFLTLPDDEAKLERYVARFRVMQDKFRAEGWGPR